MSRSKPRAVKIIPEVFFSAKENRLPQIPFRLHCLAKAFDRGYGHVSKGSLKDFMKGCRKDFQWAREIVISAKSYISHICQQKKLWRIHIPRV